MSKYWDTFNKKVGDRDESRPATEAHLALYQWLSLNLLQITLELGVELATDQHDDGG